jgi:phage terminase Nu1 subunit (DNA packaging protein)
MALINACILSKEASRLKRQKVEMTQLQQDALHERVVFLTAASIARRAKKGDDPHNLLQRIPNHLLQRIAHLQQDD